MDGRTKPNFTSSSQRTRWYKEQKQFRKQKQRQTYELKRSKTSTSCISVQNRTYSERQVRRKRKEAETEKRRLYEREKKRKQRLLKKAHTAQDRVVSNVFKHRMNKKRAIDRLKEALPKTPERRTAALAAYLNLASSPTVISMQHEHIITTPEERKNLEISKNVVENITTVLSDTKLRRSTEKRSQMHTIVASVSGENVAESKAKTNLAKRLGINVRRISNGQRIRSQIIRSNNSIWQYTKNKTRSDKVGDGTKRLIYDFWMSPGVSRPTGNKSDIKRHRIGPKNYLSHSLYILEKTQTDVYMDFQKQHSDIKISQRTFEKLKPFFVKPVRTKDKTTCCCRYHIEFNHAFKKCMQFRKSCEMSNDQHERYPVYDRSEDFISSTMCRKAEEQRHNKKACIDRVCENCGVRDDLFTERELSETETAECVEWERYEYQNVKGKGSVTTRKLVLVKQVTKVGELFKHFRALLEKFPRHWFNADWQNKQAKHIIEQLPVGDIVLVHDFSENYKCSTQKEIQSSYFQKTEVSVHVTIIHRHEVKEDGVIENRNVIQEQFFVISPDLKHDHHFSYHVQELVIDYLKSMNYPIKTIHEFTDGCASQYKSRHCIGSLKVASEKMGHTFIRNYFETSHAKGPQDAAGGLLKQQADLAVLRGNTIIQSAKDFYNFVNGELKTPKTISKCKQRLFCYVEEIPRDKAKYFRPVQSVRSVHQVFATEGSATRLRELSCYCLYCIEMKYAQCINREHIGADKTVNIVEEKDKVRTDADCDNDQVENTPLYRLVNSGDVIAVRADDEDYYMYLLKATQSVITLDKTSTDHYQTTYEAGTKVIRGHYLCRTGSSQFNYRLETKYDALVPASSVVYICFELSTDNIKLSVTLHRSILASLK